MYEDVCMGLCAREKGGGGGGGGGGILMTRVWRTGNQRDNNALSEPSFMSQHLLCANDVLRCKFYYNYCK